MVEENNIMLLHEIDKILAACTRREERQAGALEQTRREIVAWKDLRSAKEKETKK